MIPTIDIGGRWVPTNFVRRASGDAGARSRGCCAARRGPRRGRGHPDLPRGHARSPRPSSSGRRRSSRERQPEMAPLADRLQHLLPPRLGGPLALIDKAPDVDIVFCGHVGFDGFQHISDIWAGELVGSVIGVKFWRVPAAEIPADEAGRAEWLYATGSRWTTGSARRSSARGPRRDASTRNESGIPLGYANVMNSTIRRSKRRCHPDPAGRARPIRARPPQVPTQPPAAPARSRASGRAADGAAGSGSAHAQPRTDLDRERLGSRRGRFRGNRRGWSGPRRSSRPMPPSAAWRSGRS